VAPSELGDGLIAVFKRRMFKVHIMLDENIINVDDYLVVVAYANHIVFDTFACLD
jgi:hypothetical protein